MTPHPRPRHWAVCAGWVLLAVALWWWWLAPALEGPGPATGTTRGPVAGP